MNLQAQRATRCLFPPPTRDLLARRDIAIFPARGRAYRRVPRLNPPFTTVFIQQPVPGPLPTAPLSPSNSLFSSTCIAKSSSSFQVPILSISCKNAPDTAVASAEVSIEKLAHPVPGRLLIRIAGLEIL